MIRKPDFLNSTIAKLIFAWGIIDFATLILIDLLSGRFNQPIYIGTISVIYFVTYLIEPARYLLTILLLALLEETIVYFLGGGLHGLASSLIKDYIRSIPIFFTMAILWLMYMKSYRYKDSEIFIMAGLQGFFFEIVLSGMILNVIYLLLFGGASFIIYGLLILLPKRPQGVNEIGLVKKIVMWLVFLALEIIVGISTYLIYP